LAETGPAAPAASGTTQKIEIAIAAKTARAASLRLSIAGFDSAAPVPRDDAEIRRELSS
jgi:hypothetical protein